MGLAGGGTDTVGKDANGSVVCIGESMALFVPTESAQTARTWIRTAGGAESNVAIHLRRLGLRSRWVSAVGDDALGVALLAEITGHGVDTTAVRVDRTRPTGLYLKEPGVAVRYYRSGSAASALGPEVLPALDLRANDLVHVSGITPALSASCAELMRAVLRPDRDYRVSFDVNYRPALAQDPQLLAELANAADVLLVGDDEAATLWGVSTVDEIGKLFPGPETVVVKHGANGASIVVRDGDHWYAPALRVSVVEPVGAGDAFAAGYLASALAGTDPLRRLRSGHLCAASALRTAEDIGPALSAELVNSLLSASEAEWAAANIYGAEHKEVETR